MYSATFAITAIIGIAAINLFMGFATAVLLGRGPKSWSAVERSIVFRPVTLRGLRFTPRPKVERVDLNVSATMVTSIHTDPAVADGSEAAAAEPAAVAAQAAPDSESAAAGTPADASAADAVPVAPQKIVIASKPPVDTHENDPPEQLLEQQLNSWRDGDLSQELPSMSGLRVELLDEADDEVRDALADAVYARVKSQLRRDRRVMRLSRNVFAWFSPDVPPEDAILPVERIRQIITSTTFQRDGSDLALKVVGGVVLGKTDDAADGLLVRLKLSLQYALEKGEHSTCLDTGAGPEGVKPFRIEVEESVCTL